MPAPDQVDACFGGSDRNPQVLVNLAAPPLDRPPGGTGYLSILPVDQGIEHSGAASFAPNPDYFDPENIVELAIEGGCNARRLARSACSGAVARRYAHRIPFIVKINHNQLLTYPNGFRQTCSRSVEQAWDMGAAAVGATIYFGSDDADREIEEIAEAFAARARARAGDDPLVLPAQRRVQEGRRRLPHRGRPHRRRRTTSASPSAPTSSSRSCRPTTAATTRSSSSARPTSGSTAELVERPSGRLGPLAGGQLLHGQDRPDQLRRRQLRRERPRRRRCAPRWSTSAAAAWA